MSLIDAEKIDAAFRDSLYNEDEIPDDGTVPEGAVIVEGITSKFGFHPERLRSHESEIRSALLNLPDQFQEGEGGGSSFLNACNDLEGEQWTGLHQRMEQLFCLGIGLGAAKWCLPREMWSVLPGGMPYVVVDI